MEKGIDEECTGNDAEAKVPKCELAIYRDESAVFDDCTNQPEHECEGLCSQKKRKTDPKMEKMARIVKESEVSAREISWFGVRWAWSANTVRA